MRFIFFALGFALSAATAAAQPRPELRFDPDKIEFATPWAQSSPCLGDRSDPLCTAQAILICSYFARRPECNDFPRMHKFSNPQGWTRIEYRILKAGILTRAAVARYDRESVRERFEPLSTYRYIKPGLLQVLVEARICAPEIPTCEGVAWAEQIVVAEPRGRRWEYTIIGLFDASHWILRFNP